MTDDDFCALYESHAKRLWAYVFRATRDAAAAEDVVQETFTRTYSAKSLSAADGEHRRRYLYKVATNLIRQRHRRLPDATSNDLLLEQTAESAPDRRLAVTEALNTLSRLERQTLWLAYVEGWSWREVARMLGYREGSIRQVGVRARRRFRAVFAGAGHDRQER